VCPDLDLAGRNPAQCQIDYSPLDLDLVRNDLDRIDRLQWLRLAAARQRGPTGPHPLLGLEIPGLRRRQWRELAAVGFEVEQRGLVEAVEAAHQHGCALDADQSCQ
jgi:hypothetical protein